MVKIGYHASHEQFNPTQLLEYVKLAEKSGFQAVQSSDHIKPFSSRQGQSGFAWAWLGAAMSSSSLNFGVVTCPIGFRYHPAIIAQASATLTQMFPGRFWMAVGSGQFLNEGIVREQWPTKEERNKMLIEAIDIIHKLHAGEQVSTNGLLKCDEAKLFVYPEKAPMLMGAALSPETAAFIAPFVDGLITISTKKDTLLKIIDSFKQNGGAGKPMFVQLHLSYAKTEKEAMDNAVDQWLVNAIPGNVNENLSTGQFDDLFSLIDKEHIHDAVFVSVDLQQHKDKIKELSDMGFSEIYLHNVGKNQVEFIQEFGNYVLPHFI